MKRISKTRSKLFAGIGRSVACLFVLSLLLLAGSCTQADVVENGIPPQALKEVDAEFNLSVQANQTPVTRSITFTPDGTIESDTLTVGAKDAAQDAAQTKAAAALSDDQEKKIAELWVGQYDATGKCLFRQYLKDMTSNTVILKLKQSKDKSSKSRVYFVANAGDLGDIAQETNLLTRTLNYVSTPEGLPENDLCPMMGMWEDVVAVGGVKDIVVELTRLLAKITFTYSTGAGFDFTPASLTLENAPTSSQVEAPKTQLAGIGYTNYTGENDKTATTVHWYLPENMAGTVTGENAVDSKKKKIGKGVTDATCIVLTGDAKQSGVTYSDVTFRFYPGIDDNNYDIQRNAHYATSVTLMGIDIADERITVGTIPPIEVDGTAMSAQKGSTKEIQITARPGQEWVFDMPDWLSALLDNEKNIPSGATTTHQGPALLLFKAETANPTSQERTVTFPIHVAGTPQDITITQAGSTLEVSGAKTIDAAPSTGNTSTFTATEGLSWAISANQDWLTLKDPIFGDMNATGISQNITYDAVVNPDASPRNGDITVKVGDAITGTDAGLTKTITVTQQASSLTASATSTTLAATKDAAGTLNFTGTAGLSFSVTNPDWLTLIGTTSGITNGNNQTIQYKTNVVNLDSTERAAANITVKAGNITQTVAIKQSGSTFTVNKTEIELVRSASSGSVTVTGTSGLPWTVTPDVETNGITPNITSSTALGSGQTLKFTATKNTGDPREAEFTIAVIGGNHSKKVKVKQEGIITLTIDQSVLTSYITRPTNITSYPPFDYEGTNRLPNNCSFDGTATMNGTYTIQVERGQGDKYSMYEYTPSYCSSLKEDGLSGWRVPTLIEVYAMYINLAKLEEIGAERFYRSTYWSNSYWQGESGYRCNVTFTNGRVDYDGVAMIKARVRCVRNI